ncbi:TPA: transcriptional repressor [Candidatus Gastranaerophilales bacterium HUM_6]|nr:transcriptional repressor [Cyanobacteriota bacterium]CDE91816.1 fur family transcriptional regulator [Fusobacterium sp. CAG:815]DAA90198.1 MAG TPA: transcriptional repressor [Candidatus Gastranaerophilales bacterium HUM_7]DAA91142.1 MAG TPA: transcriptional repressor [Candidatus Gastranaerophilales bacterium HUM_6]DAB04302.1 MAG TPA: transcriptional repressor [Candidatus Gastranaerophilales bacterium HUM_12]DAB06161.1 MAG TPA: transcriptional repressor [Candidatus Gastranaerophilales bacter
MNYSKQREIILDTLSKNAIHPTAEALLEFLKRNDSNVGMTTLYRNLNQLADAGLIKKIDGLEPSAHFDHNTFEHYHFICEKCKKVYDIPSSVAPDLVKNTTEATGFDITSHDIVFHGICSECKRKDID